MTSTPILTRRLANWRLGLMCPCPGNVTSRSRTQESISFLLCLGAEGGRVVAMFNSKKVVENLDGCGLSEHEIP